MALTCQNYIDAAEELGIPELGESAQYSIDMVNLARMEIITERLWPFRVVGTTLQTAGYVSLPRLGVVREVLDVNYKSVPAVDPHDLYTGSWDGTETATVPEAYFVSTAALGAQTVATYPLASFYVSYYQNPAVFTATADVEDLLPDAFKMAVAYRVAMHANLRVGIADMAAQYRALSTEAVEAMKRAYMDTVELPLDYTSDG